jgi:hypothetical protein
MSQDRHIPSNRDRSPLTVTRHSSPLAVTRPVPVALNTWHLLPAQKAHRICVPSR